MVKLDINDKVIMYCFYLFVVEAINVMVVRFLSCFPVELNEEYPYSCVSFLV